MPAPERDTGEPKSTIHGDAQRALSKPSLPLPARADNAMSLDDDPYNADWPKLHTWDVWYKGHQVSTLEELRLVFSGHSDKELKDFLKAPVARIMPEPLKSELEALRV